ncbi:serine/threonine protein kinase [Actinomadura madurae]|uniref:Serine/threonine protein kinase n=1 Tax=Actinomadura madurae TaxID=1993 RepID=A0A1I5KS97_9ACTN|nr:serine/threonine-protein kinase [Actinomadura madurae]SFO87990.1 Serine/threonine protein kinase [Actinomadura madurae]SPT49876.1 Serine/threonine-protein kinase AfsK [Actinomadura madurae]
MTTHAGENGEALRPEDPAELGPYRLVGRLGRGGMGTVYLGEDPSGRRVAVKVINRELAGEGPFRDRFRREVTAARQVRRFCTAPVMDAELDRDPLYVVTEYIEGPSLESAVAERGPLPGSDLEGLAVGVATALAAIHGAGIVHRDLKPANVLLSSTGPRVIDFGIARALDAADGPTRTGQFVGTPNYLPPELLRGEQVTPASDVFSWGCVVAYAGTGSAPFAGNTVPEIFYRVAHDEPKLDGLDPGLRDVVAAALDKDPRNRPSVQDLLGRLVGNEKTDPATLAETVQASWHGPAAGPTVQGAAGQGTGGQAPTAQAAFQQPTAQLGGNATREDARPGRGGAKLRRPLIIAGAAVAVLAVLAVVGFTVLRSDGPPDDNLATAFADDFSDSNSGWGDSILDEYDYVNGKYQLKTSGTTGSISRTVPKDKVEDFPDPMLVTVTASAEGPADGRFGVECRMNEAGKKKYVFLLRNDGKGAVLRKVNGDLGTKELASPDSVPGFEANGQNRLQVACEGQEKDGPKVRLRLWVNGDKVIDETDTDQPLPNGKVALTGERGGNAAQQITVRFDDFDMSKIQ